MYTRLTKLTLVALQKRRVNHIYISIIFLNIHEENIFFSKDLKSVCFSLEFDKFENRLKRFV